MLLALELQHQVDGQTGVQEMLLSQPFTEHYQALLYQDKLEHLKSCCSNCAGDKVTCCQQHQLTCCNPRFTPQ
jgi:hypothetical protein